ncbi:MAG: recombinase family protein [Bryobacteraceae bacterium]|nr:recombinase family protein [Bryobacterales bacterium]MEB2361269.1 recombinase family protein [Bryobacterales bacterium]NUN03537.1 recombinase family protein [Bryobacteraceae bacterium]
MIKAAIYARVSTRDRGQDARNQLEQLRQFAQTQNWTIVQTYIDQESAKSADRCDFRRLLYDASRRRFDVLLFWSLDRLSREGALATLQHLNHLTSYGIQFRSFTEQYLDSCGIFREAVISILAVIAKQEQLRISERTIAGLERARSQGKTLGRPRCRIDAAKLNECIHQGLSLSKAAQRLGVSKATVARLKARATAL